MDYVDQNIYSIDEDITLNECIDIIISLYKGPNKDKVRERLHEIFIFSKITDYIMLKDALWISNSLNVPLFITLYHYCPLKMDVVKN